MVECWRMDHNSYRPHRSWDDATPVGFADCVSRPVRSGRIRPCSREYTIDDDGFNNDRAEYTPGIRRVF
jgi:hypothetical protein